MKYRETKKQEEPKPIKPNPKVKKYWLVELSLTSGKSTQFYVQAINLFEAFQKADEYVFWLGDKKLSEQLRVFRLRP